MRLQPLLRAAIAPAALLSVYLVVRPIVGFEALDWTPVNLAIHFVGGVCIAQLAEVAMEPVLEELRGRLRVIVWMVGVLALTATIAVGWEFLECLVARWRGGHGPSAGGDTLRDIAAGMAGSAAWVAALLRRRGQRLARGTPVR